jgi:uncharacterized membrane protein
MMKKMMIILGMLLLIVFAVSACRATEKCPAYGYHTPDSTENQG